MHRLRCSPLESSFRQGCRGAGVQGDKETRGLCRGGFSKQLLLLTNNMKAKPAPTIQNSKLKTSLLPSAFCLLPSAFKDSRFRLKIRV